MLGALFSELSTLARLISCTGSLVASFFTFIIAAVISGQIDAGCDNDSCPVFVIWLLTMAANGIVVSLATLILNATFVGLYAATFPLLPSASIDAARFQHLQQQQQQQQTSFPFLVVAPAQSQSGEPKVGENAVASAAAIQLQDSE